MSTKRDNLTDQLNILHIIAECRVQLLHLALADKPMFPALEIDHAAKQYLAARREIQKLMRQRGHEAQEEEIAQ